MFLEGEEGSSIRGNGVIANERKVGLMREIVRILFPEARWGT